MSAVFPPRTSHGLSHAAWNEKWMSRGRAILDGSMMALGTVLAPGRSRPAPELRDEATGLYSHAGLLTRGGVLLNDARRSGKALGLVVLAFNDLPEVRAIYGAHVAGMLRKQIVKKLKAVAGPQGLVARTGRTQFAVLLPGQSRERALKAAHRVLGLPARVELDSNGEEIVLVPELIAENIAPGDESIDCLHSEMLRELQQQRADEARRCHYLQRERERHSRPMHLVALPSHSGVVLARHANTVPMPLSARH
ncbi:MAG: diguanylate cyclase [Burkholderiales bacterium]|nr:MAG: diguanylate cyclase [Burkholderiales bacterium]